MGKHVWGPLTPEGLAATGQVPVEEPKPAEPAKPTRKRKSRWADESDKAAADGAAGKEIVLFPEKVVLSNGMQVSRRLGGLGTREECRPRQLAPALPLPRRVGGLNRGARASAAALQVIIPPAISGRGDPDVLRLHKEVRVHASGAPAC